MSKTSPLPKPASQALTVAVDAGIAHWVAVANSAKSLNTFVERVLGQYAKLADRLHQAACMTAYHAAQHGDCSPLNKFYAGLRVNDQTALRLWIGRLNDDPKDAETRWIWFTEKRGFHVIAGREALRKDRFDLADLLAMRPFFEKNILQGKQWTLELLLKEIIKAGNIPAKAGKEGVRLPGKLGARIADLVAEAEQHKASLQLDPSYADQSQELQPAE